MTDGVAHDAKLGLPGGLYASRLQRLVDFVNADIAAGAIPGAVIWISRHGDTACFEALGFAERTAQRPMQRDSIFRIASMTKPVTSVAAMMLQESGALLLGDPVSRYLPELRNPQVGVEYIDTEGGQRRLRLEPARRPISIQDLLRHTAGFTYGNFGDSLVQRKYRLAEVMDPFQSNEQMLAKLAALPLAYQPGTTFEYGMSTDVLGRLVEVVAGMPLDEFIATRITTPLGMPDTMFTLDPARKLRVAMPQRAPRSPPAPAAAPAATPAADAPEVTHADAARRWPSGGGGLLSTAGDYARFCRMLLNGGELDGVRLLSRKSVELMTHNHLPPGVAFGEHTAELGHGAPLPQFGQGYGLGFGVRMQAGLAPTPGSAGDFYWAGITGPSFWIDPVEKLIVVFMLQEFDIERRARYRALLRALIYAALP
jgi:CubicO group peptidase (beta-lactamase class C family)